MGTWVFVAVLVGPAPAAAEAPAQVSDNATALELVEQTVWVASQDTFRLDFRVLNPPEEATISVSLGAPIHSRAAFVDRLAEPSTGTALRRFVGRAIPPPDEAGVSSLVLEVGDEQATEAATDEPLQVFLPDAGVYPVSLVLHDGDGRGLAAINTFLVRTPPDNPNQPRLLVSTVLAVSGPPAITSRGEAVLGDAETQLTALAEALQPRSGLHISVAVDPHLVDALAISSDPQHLELLTQLRQAVSNHHLLNNIYVPIDGDAWIEQGLSQQIGWQAEAGADTLNQNLQVRPDQSIMLVAGSASPALLQRLFQLGVRLVVVPESRLDPADRLVSTTANTSFLLPTITTFLPAVAGDVTTTAHLARVENSALAPYLVIADLAARWFEDPRQLRGVVLMPPVTSAEALGKLLDEIETSPVLSPTTVSNIGQSLMSDVVRSVQPTAGIGFEEDYQAALNAGQQTALSYRNMVDPIATSGTPEREQIKTMERALLLSGAADLTETQRDDYLAVVAQTMRDTVAGIQPPRGQRITLTSRSGNIPILIRNNLSHGVIVRLDLDSDKLEFPDGTSQPLRLSPGVNQVQLPVRAKTSGDSVLGIRISSPDGRLDIGESRLTVRVTSLSGVGVGIAAAAAAILLAWWGRSWWSHRRDKFNRRNL